jgi:hypothetical protein
MIGTPRNDVIGGWPGGNPWARGWLTDQETEHAPSRGRRADPPRFLVGDAARDEATQPRRRQVEHAERGVARASQLARAIDDGLEHGVQ